MGEKTNDVQLGAVEILPGMTVEEMTALFYDGALVEPPYRVYQLNSKGHRYYYTFDEDGKPEFYPSVTTILSQTMPKPEHLIKWIAGMGYDEAERYKQERASYGTFMHAQFEKLIINRTYDLDGLKDELRKYIEANNLPENFIYYADDLKKDVLAFAQFVIDYDVKPLAVEIALVHPRLGYAGMIDLPCNMQVKQGAEERINAIVDFKSGRKGFTEEHEVQLHLYKDLWNENFPDMQIERVFNFAPKDWRKKPTYHLKDQTDSANAGKIPHLLALASMEDAKRDNVFTAVSGEINLDEATDFGENIISMTLADIVKKREQEQAPDNDKSVEADDLTETTQDAKIISCQNLIDKINGDDYNYSLCQTTDIAETYGAKLVDEGFNLDQHRWYSIATNIYKCSDGYVKVRGAYQSFSERQMWSDIDVHSEAEKLSGKELKAFELRMKAYEIENEPEHLPNDAEEKTEGKAEINESDDVKPQKRRNTRKKAETPSETKKRNNSGAKKPENKKSELLNEEVEL